ncbi:hypothetical protein [Microbacterium sp. EF45047]|uniref:hypothetical protein n=1 Tax=Microbacterium sp. EF45047 TaxID=2809708 RepID=UPI0023498110|nr:hypothetical protein [Microbacterium sp. EF45047]WCM55280.1 hypothetical protein JRG78_10010 [Microbacterium sp. EF45047]
MSRSAAAAQRRRTPAARQRRRSTAQRRRATVARRRRRMRVAAITAAVGAAASVLLLILGLVTSSRPEPFCLDEPQAYPAAGVAGWNGEHLENAATIVRTARELGFARDGQIIGVMTAMGESSLRNIAYGDWETSGVTNPDGTPTSSIGLFQQQDWWGSREARLDPATAAALFYTRLARLDGWQQMEPSHAIHRVQVNSDPEHYARFEADAAAVVDALSGPCPATTR